MTGIDVVGASNGAPAADAPPGSMLATLRARAAAQRKDKHLDLPVGGAFGDSLVIRYRLLPVDQAERFAELGERLSNIALVIDMMVTTCMTVLWREHEADTDLGVGLDQRLWDLLGWPMPETVDELTPHEVVVGLFADNALALGEHAERLATWMRAPEGPPVGEPSAGSS